MGLEFSKQIALGNIGTLGLKEADGVLVISVALADGVGGGRTKVAVVNTSEIKIPVKDFADAALQYIETKVQKSSLAVAAIEQLRKALAEKL